MSTNLTIAETVKTPAVNFNANGTLFIAGRTIPENTLEFFHPLLEWVDSYAQGPNATTTLELRIQYINTSATKSLLELLKHLEAIERVGSKVTIKWYYLKDDEDMREMGDDIQQIIHLPFEFLAVDSL